MQQSDKQIQGYKENILPFIPDGKFYFTKGVEAFEKRKFDVAIKWLRKAIESAPENPLYQCQMSIVYTEIGAYHAANQLLNDVLQSTNETYTDCYYFLANNYAHLGLLNDAKTHAEMYLHKATDGDFREDAEHLLDLVTIDEADEDDWEFEAEDELLVYQEAVFQHMEHEEWEEALPLLEEMLTLFPEHKVIQHDYAHALFFFGHADEAIRMELETLEERPDSLNSHTNLAIFYYQTGQSEEYKKHIEPLLNVYPIHEQQKLRIAVTLARTGVYDQAYSRFRKLARSQMQHHLSYYKWYSISAYQLGQPSKALSLWEEGCRKHPGLADEEGPWNV
ncbi:tetratricopeptide repeat protein [Lentibacillus salinarum]|uniref:Tetratricopeptide repeat protein n=1 Tax=Lentibacillus salinarum TaxID=446820 RepID=A0ABW3ZUD3_9BACI